VDRRRVQLCSIRLLRNRALEALACVAVDEGEAEGGGALTQAAEDASAVLSIVSRGFFFVRAAGNDAAGTGAWAARVWKWASIAASQAAIWR
jgi:hypothetical protein